MGVVAALVTLLWAQASPPEAASTLPIAIHWHAPAGCPDVQAVRAGIARGLPPIAGAIVPMTADVEVRVTDAERWQADLALRGADWTATRTLKGMSCAAVADAVGLVIGLALTNELATREAVAPPPPPPPPPLSTPAVGVALGGDTGTLPGATWGGALALGWRFARARADLVGALYDSRAITSTAFPDTGARLSLASFSARGCALWGGALSAGPCVSAGADRIHGGGTGRIFVGDATNWAPFLGAALRGEWRLSRRTAAFVDAGAAIPLVRARFSVENAGLLHQAAAVSWRGGAGIELRFR
ncbi:MAG TPA: hypothetical protein VHK47_00205 [Polyangia bacterium]|nr:hypothetical protein [Polyangia bacterium]